MIRNQNKDLLTDEVIPVEYEEAKWIRLWMQHSPKIMRLGNSQRVQCKDKNEMNTWK
jgi:hypothetical protein